MNWQRYLDDPALADFVAREAGGARLIVRRGYEAVVEALGMAGGRAAPVEEVFGGRNPHPLVELTDGERVLVRRYLRGGAVRHLNRERYFAGHRAFSELRATERARAAGVRAPAAIAAEEEPRALGYTARFASRWIAGARDLHAWLAGRSTEAGLPAWHEAGRQIGRMHAAGIGHPDLNLRNLLVRETEVSVLDLDRASLFDGPVPASRRARDLRRLARSARKLGSPLGAAQREALREGYGSGWPLADPRG